MILALTLVLLRALAVVPLAPSSEVPWPDRAKIVLLNRHKIHIFAIKITIIVEKYKVNDDSYSIGKSTEESRRVPNVTRHVI